MLKSLVQGGRFDKSTQSVTRVDPPLMFHDMLYTDLKDEDAKAITEWANGPNSFVIVAMLEADDFSHKEELIGFLKQHSAALKSENPGAKIILEKIGGGSKEKEGKKAKKSKK
jgi:pumilio family protein 6